MRTGHLKKRGQPANPNERSRFARFMVGVFFGFLAGWVAGQFTRFDTGWDLVVHLGIFGILFGVGAAIFPEKKFLDFISRLY